jgi:hypothetical protein
MASSRSNQQLFLNSLKSHQVNDFLSAVYASGSYDNLVNRRHVSSLLDLDQLATMKSIRTEDGLLYFHVINKFINVVLGAFLIDWMQCYIQEHHLSQPTSQHPRVHLLLNGINRWPKSVQKPFKKFCRSKSITTFKIYCHHILLRSLDNRPLPVLSGTNNRDIQG